MHDSGPASERGSCGNGTQCSRNSYYGRYRRSVRSDAACTVAVVCILAQLSLQGLLVEGKACPPRVRLVPIDSEGLSVYPGYEESKPTIYYQQSFTTRMSGFSSDCCESGKIKAWDVTTTNQNGWIGQVGAVCDDGKTLTPITYGSDGAGQLGCNVSLNASVRIPVSNEFNTTYLRGNTALFQLFGVGDSSYVGSPMTFQCDSGMVPIGFGAASACNSLTDFKVVCAPEYNQPQTKKQGLKPDVNSCSSMRALTVRPDSPIGTRESWQIAEDTNKTRSPYNPLIVSEADSPQSDCCQRGLISNFSVTLTSDGYIGQLEANCSNGDILKAITAGYNGSSSSCSPELANTYILPPKGGTYNYSVAMNPNTTNGDGFLNPQSFQCPDGNPVGFGAASSCTSVVAIQVYCKAVDSGGKGGLSSGAIVAIVGIIVGVLAGLALVAFLAFFIIRRRKERKLGKFLSFEREAASNPLEEGRYSLQEIELTDSDGVNSGTKTTVSVVPYSDVIRKADYTEVAHMEDIYLPEKQPSRLCFEDLPAEWHIPLASVKLLCQGDRPIVLGRGGYGVVYRAMVRRDQAAIKIVKGGGQTQQARLLHEITILEQCRSVHIVQFLGYSISEGSLLLCMEYMSCGTLYSLLRRGNEFQWYNRGWEAIQSVAAGLFCLHERNVAHLDMKTPNILIDCNKKAKIADLGLGKLVRGRDTMMTEFGTVIWMAPEQLNEGIGALASDVWSFSTIMWEVCTLRKPDRNIRIEDILVPDEAPQDLIDLIADCRARDYLQRPAMAEICDRLDCISHTLPFKVASSNRSIGLSTPNSGQSFY